MEYTDILISIRKIIRSINLESKRVQKQHGLSIPQYLCLNFLTRQQEYKASSKDIKIFLNLNASTVSGIIHRLEKKGFVAKLPNQGDRRSSFIYLTASGMDIVDKIPGLLHEKLTGKLKGLSTEELKKLQDALDLLVEFMEVEDIDASPLLTTDVNLDGETT